MYVENSNRWNFLRYVINHQNFTLRPENNREHLAPSKSMNTPEFSFKCRWSYCRRNSLSIFLPSSRSLYLSIFLSFSLFLSVSFTSQYNTSTLSRFSAFSILYYISKNIVDTSINCSTEPLTKIYYVLRTNRLHYFSSATIVRLLFCLENRRS